MTLPTKPQKEPRPIQLTVRLSKRVIEALKELAEKHNLSQADVIEHLVLQELKHAEKKK